MTLRKHQISVIPLVVGLFIGACLQYFFHSNNMEWVEKKAYEQGYFDCVNNKEDRDFETDSTYVDHNSFTRYK